MPIYEYTCKACEKKFEHLARTMNTDAKVKCPHCGSMKTDRALSVFAVGAEAGKKSSGGGHGPGCGCCAGPANGSCPMQQ